MNISDLDYLEKAEKAANVEGGWQITTTVTTAQQVAVSTALSINSGDAIASANADNFLKYRRTRP
jgi:hypothetical protein